MKSLFLVLLVAIFLLFLLGIYNKSHLPVTFLLPIPQAHNSLVAHIPSEIWIYSNQSTLHGKILDYNQNVIETLRIILLAGGRINITQLQQKRPRSKVVIKRPSLLPATFKYENTFSLFLSWENSHFMNHSELQSERYNTTTKPDYANEYMKQDIDGVLLVKNYYQCVLGSDFFLQAVENNTRIVNERNNRKCTSELSGFTNSSSLTSSYFIFHYSFKTNTSGPYSPVADSFLAKSKRLKSIPDQWNPSCKPCNTVPHFITFMNVITGYVIINTHGFILHDKKVKKSHMCPFYSTSTGMPKLNKNQRFEAPIMVLTQTRLANYYHEFIEMLLKIIFYVPFLKVYPEVKLHMSRIKPWMQELLNLFSLKNSVISRAVKTPVALVPMGNGCSDPPVALLQYANQQFTEKVAKNGSGTDKPVVIFINRKENRRLLNKKELLGNLSTVMKQYNSSYTIEIFDDTKLPSLKETIALFQKAKLIIGAHGAGLSNIVFSRPGTYVIEIMCDDIYARPCYRNMAYKLGHRYYSMLNTGGFTGKRCKLGVKADINQLNSVLEYIFSNS